MCSLYRSGGENAVIPCTVPQRAAFDRREGSNNMAAVSQKDALLRLSARCQRQFLLRQSWRQSASKDRICCAFSHVVTHAVVCFGNHVTDAFRTCFPTCQCGRWEKVPQQQKTVALTFGHHFEFTSRRDPHDDPLRRIWTLAEVGA